MAESNRPVRPVVYLIDIDEEEPTVGSQVYGLSIGGRLIEIVWRHDSHEFFKAWMPYPKVPDAVRRKLFAHYCGKR